MDMTGQDEPWGSKINIQINFSYTPWYTLEATNGKLKYHVKVSHAFLSLL